MTSRRSAGIAVAWGGFACLLQAGREIVGNGLTAIAANKPTDMAVAWFVGASLLPAFLVIAGILLWQKRSPIWGSLAALEIAVDTLVFTPSPTTASSFAATTIRVALLVVILNGVRGALAMRKIESSETSSAEQVGL